MRTSAVISGFLAREVGISMIQELRSILPDVFGTDAQYYAETDYDDPRMEKVLKNLHRKGFRAMPLSPDIKKKEFSLRLHRYYEHNDLVQFDYMQLVPRMIRELQDDPIDGVTSINADNIDPKWPILQSAPFGGGIFVSNRAYEIFKKESFVGIEMHPVKLRKESLGKEMPWKMWGPPWRQLISTITMPILSSSMELWDVSGPPGTPHRRVAAGDHNVDTFTPVEGFYVSPELHYRHSDLKKLGTFDLARTAECINPYADNPLIVSRRFYECCIKHQIKADWIPVRIDPD